MVSSNVHFKKYHTNEKEILKYAFSAVSDHDNYLSDFLFVFKDALIVTIWGFFWAHHPRMSLYLEKNYFKSFDL